MTKTSEPAAPSRELPTEWEHYQLYKDVREAIACLPIYFRTGIKVPEGVRPYRSKTDQILDRPNYDGGGNFGRLARTKMMGAFMQKLDDMQLCGIKTAYWREFLKAFQESTTDAKARTALERLKQRVQEATDIPSPKATAALTIVAELERLLDMT